jgi:predicted RNA-binding protein (virulence factor B family)
MIKLGDFNLLTVAEKSNNGHILMDADKIPVLLLDDPEYPNQNDVEVGSTCELFVFKDGEGRYQASARIPKIKLGEFAWLQVKDVNDTGAFMDWGMPKDLLVPFRHQNQKMMVGKSYVVYLLIDVLTDRLIGTGKINNFLNNEVLTVDVGDEVDLLVYEQTTLGYNVIINHLYKGLVYANEVFTDIQPGQQLKGYIKMIRPDNKIDVMLQRHGFEATEPIREIILERLKANEGYIAITDKSEPAAIYALFGVSKKVFKKAIGGLYKEKQIELKPDGIYLIA